MTSAELAAIEARAIAGTPAPWSNDILDLVWEVRRLQAVAGWLLSELREEKSEK